jgi:hypothetical protein
MLETKNKAMEMWERIGVGKERLEARIKKVRETEGGGRTNVISDLLRPVGQLPGTGTQTWKRVSTT